MKRMFMAAWLLLALSSSARAGWEEGKTAFERGDYVAVFRELLPLAEQGDVNAQFLVGSMYIGGWGVPQDNKKGFAWLSNAAQKEHAWAQFGLGLLYRDATGVSQDYVEAVKWFRRAAEKEVAPAEYALGVMHANGQWLPQDYEEVLKWFRRAAEHGYADAQYSLAILYYEGQRLPQDYREAATWFRRAAEQGSDSAQFALGLMYHRGQSVPRNPQEAFSWFRKAADQGNPDAQLMLGFMYSRGEGILQDYVQAHLWFNIAAASYSLDEDQVSAVARRDAVAGKMTPGQLEEAQRLARDWQPKPERPGPPIGIPKLGTDEIPFGDPIPQRPAWQASPSQIIEVQAALAALGYDPGPADGVLGSRTQAAIRSYQAAHELSVDGDVSETLLAKLRDTLAMKRAIEVVDEAIARPEEGQPLELHATGTGFVVSRFGHVLTNQHIVADCAQVRARRSGAAGQTAAVAAVDADNDLALLDSVTQSHSTAAFRQGHGVRPGDSVIAVGFPLQGLLASSANITTGAVSALAGIHDDIRYLQITAPVQPGNSGGPLLDMSGNVVGVVVAKLDALKVAKTTGDIPQNVNFAIKDSVARNFLDAKGVEYEIASSDREVTAAEVGKRAAAFVLLIECWK